MGFRRVSEDNFILENKIHRDSYGTFSKHTSNTVKVNNLRKIQCYKYYLNVFESETFYYLQKYDYPTTSMYFIKVPHFRVQVHKS